MRNPNFIFGVLLFLATGCEQFTVLLPSTNPSPTPPQIATPIPFAYSQLGISGSIVNGASNVVDSSGNTYVTGYTNDVIAGGTQYGTHGSYDLFVSKYNSSGVYQWTSQLGAASFITQGFGIVLDNTGNIYVSGTTFGSINGATQYGTHGTADLTVSKFNSSGVYQWTSQLAAGNSNPIPILAFYVYTLALDNTGNIYVAGRTTDGIVGSTQYGTHGIDLFVAKFNSGGIYQWASQLGVAGSALLTYGIAVDGSGNSYVTGTTAGVIASATLSGTHGNDDLIVSKFNSSGVYQWTTQIGSGSNSSTDGRGIVLDASGNSYVTGYTSGTLPNENQYGDHYNSDLIVSKFNSSGVYQWSSQLGATNQLLQGNGIALDSSGNTYVTGNIESDNSTIPSILPGATQYGIQGNNNMTITKFDFNGVYQWTSQLGAGLNSNLQGNGIALDSSSNAYVTGACSGVISGATQYGANGVTDLPLLQFDTSGVLK